jgi:hypothetical protein
MSLSFLLFLFCLLGNVWDGRGLAPTLSLTTNLCDMVTAGEIGDILHLETIFLLRWPVHLTFDLTFSRERLPPMGSPVHMCDMVTLGDKGNILQPGNHISTLMTSTRVLWHFVPKIKWEHFPPMGSPYMWYGDSRWKGWWSRARKKFFIPMSSALDLWPFDPNFNREHLPPMGSLYVWYGGSMWKG